MKSRHISMSVVIIPSTDMFLLFAMFIFLSGNFLYQSAVSVELPQSASREVVSADNPVVTVTPGGGIFLNGRKIDKEGLSTLLELMARLSEKKKKAPLLIIRADQNVAHRHVIEIIGTARESGIKRIAIATEPQK